MPFTFGNRITTLSIMLYPQSHPNLLNVNKRTVLHAFMYTNLSVFLLHAFMYTNLSVFYCIVVIRV